MKANVMLQRKLADKRKGACKALYFECAQARLCKGVRCIWALAQDISIISQAFLLFYIKGINPNPVWKVLSFYPISSFAQFSGDTDHVFYQLVGSFSPLLGYPVPVLDAKSFAP